MKKLLIYLFLFLSFSSYAQKPKAMAAVAGDVTDTLPGGRMEVFVSVSGNNGAVYHTWQNAGGGWEQHWTPYLPAPDENTQGLAAGKDRDGRMIAAWISSGRIYIAAAKFKNASLFSGNDQRSFECPPENGKVYPFKQILLVNNPDGMVELLARNERGRIYAIRELQQDPSNNSWSWRNPLLIGGGDVQYISVTKWKGKPVLAGTGKDGKVYLKFQLANGEWENDPWFNAGSPVKLTEATIQESSAQQLQIVGLAGDGKLFFRYQGVKSNNFTPWYILRDNAAGKIRGPLFFNKFKDGSLFITAHKVPVTSQFIGGFGKLFQGPNNGGWTGLYFSYQAPANPSDFLGHLSADAFTLLRDQRGIIHYFSCYRVQSRVEHYIDFHGASPSRMLAYDTREHMLPDLPWQFNQQ